MEISREKLFEIAYEAHTMGRIYTIGGEKLNPADEFKNIEKMIDIKLQDNKVNRGTDMDEKKITNEQKQPIGLMPKYIHREKRFYDVCGAIARYYSAGFEIPIEWVEEYNELLEES